MIIYLINEIHTGEILAAAATMEDARAIRERYLAEDEQADKDFPQFSDDKLDYQIVRYYLPNNISDIDSDDYIIEM